MRFTSRQTALFGLVSAIIINLVGCGSRNEYQPPPVPKVTVAMPVQRDVTSYVDLVGRAAAVESVEIRARVKGFLQAVHFQDGDNVNRGDRLFTIEPHTYIERMNQAKAELANRKSQLDVAQRELQRILRLHAAKATSQSEVDSARATAESAQAAWESAQSLVKETKIEFGYTNIVAPISGRIGERLLDTGNLVGDGQSTLLTTIVKLDPIHVYFSISQNDLLRFMEAQRRERGMAGEGGKLLEPALAAMTIGYMSSGLGVGALQAVCAAAHSQAPIAVHLGLPHQTDFPIEGVIDYADNQLDPATATFLVRGVFPNANRMVLPNMTVRIRVPVGKLQNALLVPERALGADQGGRFVLVVGDDNSVERRTVRPGIKSGELIVIEEGLRQGEWVVINGMQRARAGAKVDPQKTTIHNAEPR